MSDAIRRRGEDRHAPVVEVRTTKEILKATRESWDVRESCALDDFVNCTFGENGGCKNPRHSRLLGEE